MKRYAKIAATLALLVLYCFVICQYSSAVVLTHSTSFPEDSRDHQSYISLIATDLAINSTQSESYAKSLNHPTTNSLKNHANEFLVCTRSAELFLTNTYSKYQQYATDQIACYRPVDIIFPAHYFW